MIQEKRAEILSAIPYIFFNREQILETCRAMGPEKTVNISRQAIIYHLEYLINYIYPSLDDTVLSEAFKKLLPSLRKTAISVPFNDSYFFEFNGLDSFVSDF